MRAAGASGNSQRKEPDCRVAAQREKERETEARGMRENSAK